VVAGNTTDKCRVFNIILIVHTRMLIITCYRSACGKKNTTKVCTVPTPLPLAAQSVFPNTATKQQKPQKIGKSRVTSISRCTGYRYYTEDLKTDPERGRHKKNFEPPCACSSKIRCQKRLQKKRTFAKNFNFLNFNDKLTFLASSF